MRGERLLGEVMEGRMVGKRGQRISRILMMDELLEKDTYEAMIRRADDRSGLRDPMPRTCQMAES